MKHVETIKKLLRLARDNAASPAEAANALNRALDLITRHNVDVATLDLDGPTEHLVNDRIHVGERISQIKFLVATILQEFFNVRICISRPDLRVVGRESDVAIAGYVFDFLTRTGSRSLREYCARERKARRKVNAAKKSNYVRGWIYAVSANLRPPVPEVTEAGNQIVTSQRNALDRFYREQFPETVSYQHGSKNTPNNHNALVAGFRDGDTVRVRPAVTTTDPLTLE